MAKELGMSVIGAPLFRYSSPRVIHNFLRAEKILLEWLALMPFLALPQSQPQILILFTDTGTVTEQEVLMEQKEPFFGNTYSWLKTRDSEMKMAALFMAGICPIIKNIQV
jgi:hypothetical protein